MKQLTLALVAGVTLMACSPTAPTPTSEPATSPTDTTVVQPPAPTPPVTVPPADANADTCNRAQYIALIGKPESDPAVPAASSTVRRIHPGDPVTMDFSPARLNIDIDAQGVITGLRCG